MNATYRLNADELDARFLAGLKKLFHTKEIEIVVSEVDETGYLLSSTVNRERLLTAVANAESGHNLVEANLPE